MADNLQTTTLVVGCFDDAPGCRVHFEPEGAAHDLAPGEEFIVEVPHRPGEQVEVFYGAGSLSITGAERATTKDGRELKL